MRWPVWVRWSGISLLALALMLGGEGLPGLAQGAPPPGALALTGATIYPAPDSRPIAHGTVVMAGGKIVAVGSAGKVRIPAGATVIDCDGLTVVAGYQNSHVHFTEAKWLGAGQLPAVQVARQLREILTRYGFTTVVDTGSSLPNTAALRRRIEAGEVPGPRILTAGGPLYPQNGIPYYLRGNLPPEVLSQLQQPATPEQAAAMVEEHAAGGADIIKLFTGSWVERGQVLPMRADIAAAAVAAAHRHGLLVFTHPSNVAGLQVALAARVDVLAHAIEDLRGWDDAYLGRMKAARMTLIPTLHLFHDDADIAGIQREVGAYAKMGGLILFGTDVGFLTDYDTTDELMLMHQAGLSFPAILASLTTAPAARFGEAKRRGRVAPGMDADLVVLAADPARDIRALAAVRHTIRRGAVIYTAPPILE